MKVRKSDFGINLKAVKCPKCDTEMPKVRAPKSLREALFGGWTCKNCGCKMDKMGKEL